MSHRSKREVAPATPQALPPGVPLWGGAAKPGVAFPLSGEAMALRPGWWTAPPPASTFVSPYGSWMGPVPTPDGQGSQYTSNDPLERSLCGYVSLLQNGQTSLTVSHSPKGPKFAASDSKDKTVIDIDDGDMVRTEKRLSWMPDEDVRLVSAWLFHSNDPINGNGKKNDHYWGDVHTDFNKTTPRNRNRKVKHLRDRWQKIKRWVGFFCGSWKKATSIYVSGQSDDQLREKALQFYLDDYKEGPFTVMHCWQIMKDEPKWLAILDDIENSNKRKLDDDGAVRDNMRRPEDISEKERPIGTKEAKKQRMGKGKNKVEDIGLDEELKKYIDIQAAATKRNEEFLETQHRVSDAKVEAARLRKEAALLESYKALMGMDTSGMNEEMKAEHKLGLKILREKLVGHTN
ncbi:unnamed protein product [Urochloa humidicola]